MEILQKVKDRMQGIIWTFYRTLKACQINPGEARKENLKKRVDMIRTAKTGFPEFNSQLERLHANKEKLLLLSRTPRSAPRFMTTAASKPSAPRSHAEKSPPESTAIPVSQPVTASSAMLICQKPGLSFRDYLDGRFGFAGITAGATCPTEPPLRCANPNKPCQTTEIKFPVSHKGHPGTAPSTHR